MKALVLSSYGSDDHIAVGERPMPEPEANEVLIEVKATPVNPSDLIFLAGRNPNSRQLPTVPGFEGAGIVIKSGGGDAAEALVGKNVSFRSKHLRDGSWAQYVATDARNCIELLPAISFVDGCMLQVNPLTAWSLVDCAQKAGHHCAIQNASASALGRMVIRFAAKRKLDLINIVRRPEQAEMLVAIGGSNVCSSSDPGFEQELAVLAKELGPTVAFDAIAGEATESLLKCMPQHSEVWVYGALSEKPVVVDPMLLVYGQRSVRGFWGPPEFYSLETVAFNAAVKEIQENLSTVFKSEVKATVAAEEFRSALDSYKSDMTGGKVILCFNGG